MKTDTRTQAMFGKKSDGSWYNTLTEAPPGVFVEPSEASDT